jgi:hypothetical protein
MPTPLLGPQLILSPPTLQPPTNRPNSAEAQHLLVVNYFADFLESAEYKDYLTKEQQLLDSKEALGGAFTSAQDLQDGSLNVQITDTSFKEDRGKTVVLYHIDTYCDGKFLFMSGAVVGG